MLALTLDDFDFDNNIIRINKTFTVLKGGIETITPPKTKKSRREIDMPAFCMDIIKEYSGQLYGLRKHDRIFPTNKYFLSDKMTQGSDLAEVKRIRIHDLRHWGRFSGYDRCRRATRQT